MRIPKTSLSSSPQRHRCNFRWAIEPEGQPDGADAAVDIELQTLKMKDPFYVFPSPLRKVHGADKRQAHLASMGMAAEHELNTRAGRIVEESVGEVGCVAHEQDRLVGTLTDEGRNCPLWVGMAFDRIVKPGKPEPSGITLQGDASISENNDAAVGERLGDCMRADDDIVIAEDGVAPRTLQTFEDAGAFPCVGYGPFARQQFVGHEIAGEKNGIGAQAIDVVRRLPGERTAR